MKQAKALRRRKRIRKEANMHQQALRRKRTEPRHMSKESVLAARKPIKKEGDNESNVEGAD